MLARGSNALHAFVYTLELIQFLQFSQWYPKQCKKLQLNCAYMIIFVIYLHSFAKKIVQAGQHLACVHVAGDIFDGLSLTYHAEKKYARKYLAKSVLIIVPFFLALSL